MTIYLSLFVALVGILMYALSKNGKVVEIGRILFFCGVLAFLLSSASIALRVLKG
jgi:Na+/phosphate symporter